MVTFRQVRSNVRITGFHCHHLIPLQVVEAREFGIFFGIMKSVGFSVDDFCTNGMHLPSDEKTAWIVGRPIHRGGHPLYNKLVAEQIAEIAKLPFRDAIMRLNALQSSLRSALNIANLSELELIRDPMRSSLARDLDSVGLLSGARMKMPRLP